jgi:quercetin dioxygenase-like cupin family protein
MARRLLYKVYKDKSSRFLALVLILNKGKVNNMKVVKLTETNEYTPNAMKRFFLVEDSEHFKIINFNLDEGVTFPVHSHDLDGELSIQVLEGEGFFLAEKDAEIPATVGDILISEIREPHGVRATTKMRIIVTIAPPI